MGMTPEQYWHGEPELTRAYIQAFKLRKEERNYEMWLQGWYIHQAILAGLSHLGEKSKIIDYIEEPIKIFPPTEKELEEQRKKEAEELEAKLNAFMRNFNGR